MKISQNDVQTAAMTWEQLQNEFDYMVAQQMLNDEFEDASVSERTQRHWCYA